MNLKKTILLVVGLVLLVVTVGSIYAYNKLHTDVENAINSPEGWRSEVLKMPLMFSDIDYTGEEHVKFAPGWGNVTKEDYFSYAFFWHIEGNKTHTPTTLDSDLRDYFDGLMSAIGDPMHKTTTDLQLQEDGTIMGTVAIPDEFFKMEIITLHIKITQEPCGDRQLVWFYASPQPYEHAIWGEFSKLSTGICN